MDLVALIGVEGDFARGEVLQTVTAVGDHQDDAVGTIAAEKGGNAFGAGQRIAGEAVGFEVLHVVVHFTGGQAHLQRLQFVGRVGEHDSAARQQAC